MAPGQFVAYKRLWRENFFDRRTRIPRSDFFSSQRSDSNTREKRFSADRFTSLFEVENCPTNGGKLRIGLISQQSQMVQYSIWMILRFRFYSILGSS